MAEVWRTVFVAEEKRLFSRGDAVAKLSPVGGSRFFRSHLQCSWFPAGGKHQRVGSKSTLGGVELRRIGSRVLGISLTVSEILV